MDRNSVFANAFWAGLAAPVGLYAPAPDYKAYSVTGSVGQSFGTMASFVNASFRQTEIGFAVVRPAA